MAGDNEPNAPLTAVVGIVGAVLLFVLIVLLEAVFYNADEAERRRKVEGSVPDELAQVRSSQEALLNGYRWIDEKAGVVGIPIDVAMRLLVARGEAAMPGSPAPAAGATAPGRAGEGVTRGSGR
jgi:hypothetical protein